MEKTSEIENVRRQTNKMTRLPVSLALSVPVSELFARCTVQLKQQLRGHCGTCIKAGASRQTDSQRRLFFGQQHRLRNVPLLGRLGAESTRREGQEEAVELLFFMATCKCRSVRNLTSGERSAEPEGLTSTRSCETEKVKQCKVCCVRY